MSLRRSPTLAALTAISLLAGCAAYTPRMASNAKPAAEEAVVYGRFSIDTRKIILGMDGHASMGLGLKCSDGREYLLRFYIDKPVHAIKVSPATCSVKETVYSNADGQVRGRRPFNGDVLQNLEFKPGVAYYVGDFFAAADTQVSGTRVNSSWRIRDVKIDYETTTAELRSEYPGLAQMQTANVAR